MVYQNNTYLTYGPRGVNFRVLQFHIGQRPLWCFCSLWVILGASSSPQPPQTAADQAAKSSAKQTNQAHNEACKKIMNHQQIIEHLRVNRDVFKHFFQDLSIEQARWKPRKDRWSMLEVINHLYDEEREDFRKRLGLVLDSPDAPWPSIDPERWVVQRSYSDRNLLKSLHNFLNEREKSLVWLDKLDSANWQATHRHPQMGPMSAELILANWLAHDLFHIRQANDLHFAWLKKVVAPVTLDYSGWE